ncbi:AraC family transcriptional regulator [Olivibacter ginsenosidimutans]|uniref:AraC family transcriptional regulator n=1 Tax=Olivibacter ginsenosidimutans TaxID=1176537 RepID=A0ABP9BU86_9SPHI
MQQNKHPTVPSVFVKFAHLLGTQIKNGRIEIPEKFGKGYCAGFVLNEHIRMLILHYKLNGDLLIENPDSDVDGKMILFKFQNIFPKMEPSSVEKPLKAIPSVLIVTRQVNTNVAIPVHTNTATINIEVNAHYLDSLFDPSEKSTVLQSLLQNTQPLLFEQLIYPSIQKIVDEILTESVDETFKLFFLRIKAEELVCRLLMELEKRDEKHLYALNSKDIQVLYKIKEQMLEHLDCPPLITDLASYAHMSPSKLKRLFKQIFGNSIFRYYQEFRMKEAARLLREKRSVSEVGYHLGFTNLSHFANVFEQHMGMKPRDYLKKSSFH